MKLVFIDTETTGLSDRAEIWEIGAILRDADRADVEYAWQIRPTLQDAEPTGLRIGRYYERCQIAHQPAGMARRVVHPEAPLPELPRDALAYDVAAEVAALIDGAYLVGAVPWFDERKLQRFLAGHEQCATNHYHLIDVETLAAGKLGTAPPWNFDTLLASFGLAYAEEDRHTALGDARMARDLYDAVLGVAK